MNAIADPILRESHATYQEKARDYLTSHQLADFRRCPLLYRKKKLGLVEDEDRPAYLVGRALHTLVLPGQEHLKQDCEGDTPNASIAIQDILAVRPKSSISR